LVDLLLIVSGKQNLGDQKMIAALEISQIVQFGSDKTCPGYAVIFLKINFVDNRVVAPFPTSPAHATEQKIRKQSGGAK
jgi:hypothetical protein